MQTKQCKEPIRKTSSTNEEGRKCDKSQVNIMPREEEIDTVRSQVIRALIIQQACILICRQRIVSVLAMPSQSYVPQVSRMQQSQTH